MTLQLYLSSEYHLALPMISHPLDSSTLSPHVLICLPLSPFPSIIPSKTSLAKNLDDSLIMWPANVIFLFIIQLTRTFWCPVVSNNFFWLHSQSSLFSKFPFSTTFQKHEVFLLLLCCISMFCFHILLLRRWRFLSSLIFKSRLMLLLKIQILFFAFPVLLLTSCSHFHYWPSNFLDIYVLLVVLDLCFLL